ncbi:MAG: hypothetical protein ACJAY8_000252 [Sphingobacteriales bacterium]|jgi:hypothetical protein
MKSISIILLCLISLSGFAQQDSTAQKRSEYLKALEGQKAKLIAERSPQKEVKPNIYANLSDEGHSQFQKTVFISGLLINSFAFPALLNLDGRQAFGAGVLFGAASYVIPNLLLRNTHISQPMADAFSQSYFRGAIHTGIIGAQLGLESTGLGVMALILPNIEGYGSMFIARNQNFSEGTVALSKNMHDLFFAHAFSVQADAYNVNLAVPALAGIAGYAVGVYLDKGRNYTRGDAHLLTASSIYGSLTSAFILATFESSTNPFSAPVYTIGALAGGIGGVILGDYFSKKVNLSQNQGTEIKYGMLAGGLAGLGIAALFTESNEESYYLLAGSFIGASISGFFLHQKHIGTRVAPKPQF